MFAFTRGDGRLCAALSLSAMTIGAASAVGAVASNAITSSRYSVSQDKTLGISTDCKRFAGPATSKKPAAKIAAR